MRLLLVSIYDTARSGGLSTHVNVLEAGLRREGHEVRIVTPQSTVPTLWRRLVADLPRVVTRLVQKEKAYLHFLHSARTLVASAVAKILRMQSIDLIHAHDPVACLASMDALSHLPRDGRPSLVLTVHGDIANMATSDGILAQGGPSYRAVEAMESQAYLQADVLIAVDRRLAGHCEELTNGCSAIVFANFVDTECFRPAATGELPAVESLRRGLKFGSDDLIFLTPRRLVKKNGVLFAVRAMAEGRYLSALQRRIVLLVAGSGPERTALERESNHLGLCGDGDRRVRFLGDVSHADLPLMYRLVDAVLIPSVPDAGVVEATSLSALEAMATGKVVIASAIGGLSELIDDGRTGCLVPPADPARIAAATARVFGEPTFAETIGRSARAFVEAERSTEVCVPKLVSLYRCGAVAH